ncbi:sensor histidine kinase [Terrimonas alba]|uniref:sensor histidine kinase n=1 Tax=Terrimonas alba TaxID=3349636 RepID=UPI0035F36D28
MNRFLFPTFSKKQQYLYSIAFIVLVSVVCFGLSEWVGYRVIAFILLLSVSLLAIIFDILPVLVSAALSAFIWNFFFIPPRFTIHVHATEDGILLIMYFVIAIINGVLTYKIRQIEKMARLKEEKANSVKLYNTILNSLSHELRTPIAAIIGATDNLQSNPYLTKDNKEELIGEISKAALRLNAQVENLLNISRLESGHIQPKYDWCDVVELVFATVKIVEENNRGRKIAIHINPDLPLCKTDKGMLEQVIYNLLNNAAIHTASHCQISIAASCHADLLQLIIEDNGEGFTAIAMKDAFDKLSRYKNPKTSGSGLGLSIVKGFTEALEGTVDLEKPAGGGARFILCFPVKTNYFNVPANE